MKFKREYVSKMRPAGLDDDTVTGSWHRVYDEAATQAAIASCEKIKQDAIDELQIQLDEITNFESDISEKQTSLGELSEVYTAVNSAMTENHINASVDCASCKEQIQSALEAMLTSSSTKKTELEDKIAKLKTAKADCKSTTPKQYSWVWY